MAEKEKIVSIPLLEPSPGTASSFQTLGNIIVSIIGTGVLGLPYAFKVAGWLAGSTGVFIVGVSTYYCMLLLVQCKDRLDSRESEEIKTFGDLGFKAFGRTGRYLTEFLVFISQCGGSVAYLVFIGQNLSSIFKTHNLNFSSCIFLLVPIEIALSWIQSLSALAPFSVFANVCNFLAMALVVKADLQIFDDFSNVKAITSVNRLPFAGGIAVFCFEGFGMTLSLNSSMREKRRFRWVLGQALAGITIIYILFGFFGYLAFGDQTRDIVTLNLPQNWSAMAVKIGLCIGLAFTFPVMMHPIHEIAEAKLKQSNYLKKICDENYGTYVSRALMVIALAIVASCVPSFGVFVSLVGSTVCGFLSFVLPALFHFTLLGSSLQWWQRVLDLLIFICGLIFAGSGTYNAISSVGSNGG